MTITYETLTINALLDFGESEKNTVSMKHVRLIGVVRTFSIEEKSFEGLMVDPQNLESDKYLFFRGIEPHTVPNQVLNMLYLSKDYLKPFKIQGIYSAFRDGEGSVKTHKLYVEKMKLGNLVEECQPYPHRLLL